MTKPRLTIELRTYPSAAPGHQRAYLWRCTLPNGESRTCGSVQVLSLEQAITSRKLRRWINALQRQPGEALPGEGER